MHGVRHLHLDGREVPDALDARGDEPVGDLLREGRRHGDDADMYMALMHDRDELSHILYLDMVLHRADDLRILVEECDEIEAQRDEVLVVRERGTEMADADNSDVPMVVEAEDAAVHPYPAGRLCPEH